MGQGTVQGQDQEQAGLTLGDVLRGRVESASESWSRQVLPVGARFRELLATQDAAPEEILCAALALGESRLTGASQVQATLASGNGIRQRSIPVPDDQERASWRQAVCDVLREDTVGQLQCVAWCVQSDAADEIAAAAAANSLWRLQITQPAQLEIRYRNPLTAEGIACFAACVVRALDALLVDDGLPLSGIELVDPAQRERQLVEWNKPLIKGRDGETVPGRFAAACARQPDAEAVVQGDRRLTYAELEHLSSVLADRLRAQGVAPGAVVGIAQSRSIAAIVSLLATLKAGASYLILDAAYPVERLALMVEDAGVRIVITGAGFAAAFPEHVAVIAVDGCGGSEEDATSPPPAAAAVGGGDVAYVMYTSGSTGRPKGVEIPHRAIIRLVCEVEYLQLDDSTRMLHAAPLGFDASTLEIWGPLLNGGCVVVHDEPVPTASGLGATIATNGVTSAWLTAALFNAVADEDPRQLAPLRALITGGEALSVAHVRRMQAALPEVQLYNGYGPTECTTFACTWPIPAPLPADTKSIPIGRPIAETQVHVLNARGQLLPVGVLGELYLGGAGLARGYLNRPDLTAERFVANPFCDPGERLYRTGDLVRRRADGAIEYFGRTDHQVKIRGFRIELGEIESILSGHPAILSCVVVARAGRSATELLAYYVAEDEAPTGPELRAYLAKSLPEFMLPTRYLALPAMPVTANGKLDRRALPEPGRDRPELAVAYEAAIEPLEQGICEAFSELLDIDQVGRHDNFFELGGNSLLALRLSARLGRLSPAGRVAATTIFASPTPAALAGALADCGKSLDATRIPRTREASHGGERDDPIAIVAMAGRFPGAGDVETFWRNLCEGRESIRFFSAEELDPWVGTTERSDPSYVAARGIIDDVERFDAGFFGISPREAELMDPQQRIFLELCWECMERAGHAPGRSDGPVGVFAGMHTATYLQRHVSAHPDLVEKLGAFQVMVANEKDYIATRVAHKLDLTGPAVSTNTACSTSLVAICQAVDSLRNGQCEMALAGGVSVTCPPRSGYSYQEGGMLSPDGHTRSFDRDAKGTVFSDGAAVILLKRYADAVADGNQIHALIRGGAVNNDGSQKASFTAPSSDGQAAVVTMAHRNAGVDAASIGYIEAHGTATPLGDPIEIEGLNKAFRQSTDAVGFCRIGSVKSNVGHLVVAAGAAGVIKTAFALRERKIPPSLHFETANPELPLSDSPFVVNAELFDWTSNSTPLRAGVSSFGVGGTNAHLVMEEAPAQPASEASDAPQLLLLSARTPAALSAAAQRLAGHLEAEPGINLADAAWTLSVGRKSFAHRIGLVAGDVKSAAGTLRSLETSAAIARSRPVHGSKAVFLFPGQGAQYPGMGRELHRSEPAFREAFDHCCGILMETRNLDLKSLVFSDDPGALLPTATMQPALFAMEYALAQLWIAHGVQPSALVGHSIGEFVAATLAGVFVLEDALSLVARRGALMQARPAGAMLVVKLPADAVLERLPSGLDLAAVNAPGACVVSGPQPAIVAFHATLEAGDVACRVLKTSHAFHSSMMEDAVRPFRAEVEAVVRHAPKIPILSTMTGDWMDEATAKSADYWSRQLREPVRFAAAIQRLLDGSGRALVEVGPRTTLTGLVRQQLSDGKHPVQAIASLSDTPADEPAAWLAAAGRLWSCGGEVDMASFDTRRLRRRIRLPTYPFERERYWLEAASPGDVEVQAAPAPLPTLPMIAPAPEAAMPMEAIATAASPCDHRAGLIARLKETLEDVCGFDLSEADEQANFMELGLDSLSLTQAALQMQKTFDVKITFRQLMSEHGSLALLCSYLETQLPEETAAMPSPTDTATTSVPFPSVGPFPGMVLDASAMAAAASAAQAGTPGGNALLQQVIAQQMQIMAQQLNMLAGAGAGPSAPQMQPQVAASAPAPSVMSPAPSSAPAQCPPVAAGDNDDDAPQARYDVRKSFGAIARIHEGRLQLSPRQHEQLQRFIERYEARTRKSKQYTQRHRGHMADPRVVNGFRPAYKEIIYQTVIERSKGARLWDIDGNEYVDASNGFGMSLFGWQPDFVLDAVREQLDRGYEIGPQHPLAGEVAERVCEFTRHDRAALCNTGSEAVLGAIRIARTVTGRGTVALFSGSYHGINDEVIVRGTKTREARPAAPGILRSACENVLVLEYGAPESLQIIRERAGEICAVLVEPVQSRRPDLQPVEFLRELREITAAAETVLIFDEIITGFRSHPGGTQALFGVKADLATYGKVIGGGFPIGVIAGRRDLMDALDGGHWQFGDDSAPTVGVTYFAGTFVRHPLALAATRAVLEQLKQAGPSLQTGLTASTDALADELNAFCASVGAPIRINHFASLWRTQFLEDHPLQELLFAMMRSRGVHILDNFPCFLTTAHGQADIAAIVQAYKDSVLELQASEFLPRSVITPRTAMDATRPPVPGARIGREADGQPAWFVADEAWPGKYRRVTG